MIDEGAKDAAPAAATAPGAKFPLGRVVVTPAAAQWLPAETITRALGRHQAGDWGDLSAEVARQNCEGIAGGWLLISSYFKRSPSFRIVTSADRSTTTVSMPWERRS
jgi:hypothetical protein